MRFSRCAQPSERQIMVEIIRMGPISLRFLQSKEETDSSLDIFEMILQPDARMPVAHYHESWDETMYGLAGETSVRVGDRDYALTPGESVFIKRGIVHGFANRSGQESRCLCILTPGRLGPAYFREVAAALGQGAPDPAKMAAIMTRYGLIPAPAG
jgi:quercetin dioxygenase-like cupin family protein